MTTATTLTRTKSETKAERTTAAALEIIEAQTTQRMEKSERLRQARLAPMLATLVRRWLQAKFVHTDDARLLRPRQALFDGRPVRTVTVVVQKKHGHQ